MTDKDCKECVYCATKDGTKTLFCEYPMPGYILHKVGNSVYGLEARVCSLYLTKEEIAKREKLVKELDQSLINSLDGVLK